MINMLAKQHFNVKKENQYSYITLTMALPFDCRSYSVMDMHIN